MIAWLGVRVATELQFYNTSTDLTLGLSRLQPIIPPYRKCIKKVTATLLSLLSPHRDNDPKLFVRIYLFGCYVVTSNCRRVIDARNRRARKVSARFVGNRLPLERENSDP